MIAEKPRSAAFLKRWAKDIEQHRSGDKGAHGTYCDVDEYPDSGDEQESSERHQEDRSYDQDIINEEDVQWTETLHVLGLNCDAEGGPKAFVSGPGTHEDDGYVDVDVGDDPNCQDFDFGRVACYRNLDENDNQNAIFPFHWCCYEMLAKCITGSFEASSFDDDGNLVYSLDNDLLYSIMQEVLGHSAGRFDIDHGDANDMQDRFWEVQPGYEFLVCHPLNAPGANEVVLSMFSSDAFKARSLCSDLGSRVRHDPFLGKPYDIVYGISCFISNEDLVNLARASWPIHSLLQNNDQFWRQRIVSFLPWFFELRELLEQGETLLPTNNPQRIFQWAERCTRPDRWLTGPLMGVVNRRRVWWACEQFSSLYRAGKDIQNDTSVRDEERMIRQYSKGDDLVVVSSPEAAEVHPPRKVFWVKTWSELRSQEKMLETFWDRRGSLIGISLTPNGQERRLLGVSNSDGMVIRESMRLGPEEWIKELVIHLPVPTYLDENRLETSPKGLTIILDSGKKSVMGDISKCQMQRLFSSAPKWCITGIQGTTGLVTNHLQLTQIGLVLFANCSEPPCGPPDQYRTRLGRLLWDDDYSQILGQRIQEHHALELADYDPHYHHRYRGYYPYDLTPHGALIWAKDASEQRALRRLTGCLVSDGDQSGPVRPCLSGIGAEHEPATDLPRRAVGVNKTGGLFESFDIDGPGGEVVTELEISSDHPSALKIHTSLGRTCSWGAGADLQTRWTSIKAPAGKTFIGIVVNFERRCQYRDHVDEAPGHDVMNVVGGLLMPLELFRVEKTW